MEGHTDEIVEITSSGSVFKMKCTGEACRFSSSKSDADERKASMRKLVVAVILCAIFLSVEIVGGLKANSLAILTDAAHLLTDLATYSVSLLALWASGWPATPQKSYGFFRIEVLASLASLQSIWLLTGILIYEAVQRLHHGSGDVEGSMVFVISSFGLIVNVAMAVLFGHTNGEQKSRHDLSETFLEDGSGAETRKKNLIMQGAYLHALGDLAQSFGVMIGGAIIWIKPDWKIVDVICTLAFAVCVLGTTVPMIRNIVEVLMESSPREIDPTKLENGVLEMEEVVAVHDLHVWSITMGRVHMSIHLKVFPDADSESVLEKVTAYGRENGIDHVTVQIERE